MKFLKRIIPVLLVFLLLPINVFAYDMTANYSTETNNFVLEGKATAGDAMKDVSVLLVNKSTNEIGHIGMTKVTDDGSYIYKFHFDGNIKDYDLKVRMDGKDLSGSIINEISTFTDSVIMDCSINGGSFVGSTFNELQTVLTNKFENSVNISVVLAFYNAKNVLLKCESVYDGTIDYFDLNKEIKVNNIEPPTDATLFKVFCFKGLDTLKPLNGSVVANKGEIDTLYVSSNGSGDGKSYENPTTIAEAKKIIRELKQKNKLPYGGMTVYLLGGNYNEESLGLTEDDKEFINQYSALAYLNFTSADSGTKECPITYKAYEGETPVFTNGKYIDYSSFSNLDSQDVLYDNFPESVRNNILKVDLKALGITDYGVIESIGDSNTQNNVNIRTQLFVDDYVCDLARWPNKDVEKADNGYVYSEGVNKNVDLEKNPGSTEKPILVVNDETSNRIASWKTTDSVLCEGWYGWAFYCDALLVDEFNAVDKTITLSGGVRGGFFDESLPGSNPLISKRNRFYFMNVPEELDCAGEFYIDRENGILYLLPPSGMTENSSIGLTYEDRKMMTLWYGADYINFEGITFELSKKTFLDIDDSKNITIKDCTFKNGSWEAVSLGCRYIDADSDGVTDPLYGEVDDEDFRVETKNITIEGCTFENLGKGAIMARGGSLRTLERANYVIDNCYFNSCDVIIKNHNDAIDFRGCGLTVTNCFIENQVAQGIFVGGADIDIAYNELRNVVYDSRDLGAIYVLPMAFGVNIHDNYIHDIPYNVNNERELSNGKFGKNDTAFSFKQAIYIDHYSLGGSVRNNIIENVPIGCHMRSSGLVMENNVFIDVPCTLYTGRNVDAYLRYRKLQVDGNGDFALDENGDYIVDEENGVVPDLFTDGTTDYLKTIRDNEAVGNIWYAKYPHVKTITDKLTERYNSDPTSVCYPIVDYSENLVFYDKLADYYNSDIYDSENEKTIEYSMYGYKDFITGGNTGTNIIFSLDKDIFADYENGDYLVKGNSDVLNKAPNLIKIVPKKMGLK